MPADYRKLLPTPCYECVIDIVGWREFDADGIWADGSINIGLRSNHIAIWRHSLRQRISRAWESLRGVDPEGYLDFHSRTDLNQFVGCLREAADLIFPGEAV